MSKCEMDVLWNLELNNELLSNMISPGFKNQIPQFEFAPALIVLDRKHVLYCVFYLS